MAIIANWVLLTSLLSIPTVHLTEGRTRRNRIFDSNDLCSAYTYIDAATQFMDGATMFILQRKYWILIEGETHSIPFKPTADITANNFPTDIAHEFSGSITQRSLSGVETTILFSAKRPYNSLYVLKNKIYLERLEFDSYFEPHDENPDLDDEKISGAFSFQSKTNYIHVLTQKGRVWVWYKVAGSDQLVVAPNYPQEFRKVFGPAVDGFTSLYYSNKRKAAYFLVRTVYYEWQVDNSTDVLQGGLVGTMASAKNIKNELLKCDRTEDDHFGTSTVTVSGTQAVTNPEPEDTTLSTIGDGNGNSVSENSSASVARKGGLSIITITAIVMGIVLLLTAIMMVLGVVHKRRKDRLGICHQIKMFLPVYSFNLFLA